MFYQAIGLIAAKIAFHYFTKTEKRIAVLNRLTEI